jgi:hypothetical protein
MNTLFGQVAFTAGRQRYTWADVALAAKLWGDWAKLERDVRCGIACLKRLEDTGEELTPAVVQTAAREFHHAHCLTTAEEMQTWLGQRHLTVEMWLAYLQRSMLRQRWAAHLVDILARYAATDAEVERDIIPEGFCSGQFAMWAQKLAARAAVYEQAVSPQAPGRCPSQGLSATLQALTPDATGYWSPELPPGPCQEKRVNFWGHCAGAGNSRCFACSTRSCRRSTTLTSGNELSNACCSV